jgi:hypothetical protein
VTPKYPNKIPISIGDIFKCGYPSCYGKVVSIDLIKDSRSISSYNYDYWEVKFEKICRGTLKPYKRQPPQGTARYYVRRGKLPFRLEPESFNESLENIHKLLGMLP